MKILGTVILCLGSGVWVLSGGKSRNERQMNLIILSVFLLTVWQITLGKNLLTILTMRLIL